MTATPEQHEALLDAVHRAAREAAEAPLTAEEDGEAYFAYVTATALDLLARAGYFPAERTVRALLAEITGYAAPLPAGEGSI